ncbi:hypothetical protein [Longirhabdus pacifica]|uniref:hypothetical protein n=1 Tax=Longirhabdus pacifica TaxID=2305227 RepID=UPI001008A944|nr:hypothetical protein [Longirhabdus pacifica]
MSLKMMTITLFAFAIFQASVITTLAKENYSIDWDAIFNWDELDVGLYWFDENNQPSKTENFIADRPTVIYVHGWQNGTTLNKFRESFLFSDTDKYGEEIYANTLTSWKQQGWNVGIFYWNQLSDEGEVKDAEAKIWTSDYSNVGMRWKDSTGESRYDNMPQVSAGELFYDSYVKAMEGYTGNNIRIVGHSLGNQMAVHVTKLISDDVKAGNIAENLMPNRIALLDPYYSKYAKDYLGGKWTGEVVREYVQQFIQDGVIVEATKTSAATGPLTGDDNRELEQMVAFTQIKPWAYSATDIAKKHVYAVPHYFYQYAFKTMNDDAEVRSLMESNNKMIHTDGHFTLTPEDDVFMEVPY